MLKAFFFLVLSSMVVGSLYATPAQNGHRRPVRSSAAADIGRTGPFASEEARMCASFDPVRHHDQALDVLEYARDASCRSYPDLGETVCTPTGGLYSVWMNETGHVSGAGRLSGSAPVMPELARRCQAPSAGGCRIDPATGAPTNCRNPKACHYFAMQKMAPVFGWDLERMTCSKPGKSGGYGGSCGPFQFSGAEIDDLALRKGLDPMTFCGGAVIAAIELRDHYVRFRRAGYDRSSAWRKAISRYYGADRRGLYYAHALTHWNDFQAWSDQGRDRLRRAVALSVKR